MNLLKKKNVKSSPWTMKKAVKLSQDLILMMMRKLMMMKLLFTEKEKFKA